MDARLVRALGKALYWSIHDRLPDGLLGNENSRVGLDWSSSECEQLLEVYENSVILFRIKPNWVQKD